MKKIKFTILLVGLFIFSPAFAQKFLLQETNADRKKNRAQYINVAKSCERLFLKKQNSTTIPFSDASTLTNVSLNALSEKYINNLPKEYKNDKSEATLVDRDLKNEKQKIVKFTYGILPADQRSTYNYIQIVVIFDAKSYSPKIEDIKVKTRSEYITFNEKEISQFRHSSASVKK